MAARSVLTSGELGRYAALRTALFALRRTQIDSSEAQQLASDVGFCLRKAVLGESDRDRDWKRPCKQGSTSGPPAASELEERRMRISIEYDEKRGTPNVQMESSAGQTKAFEGLQGGAAPGTEVQDNSLDVFESPSESVTEATAPETQEVIDAGAAPEELIEDSLEEESSLPLEEEGGVIDGGTAAGATVH